MPANIAPMSRDAKLDAVVKAMQSLSVDQKRNLNSMLVAMIREDKAAAAGTFRKGDRVYAVVRGVRRHFIVDRPLQKNVRCQEIDVKTGERFPGAIFRVDASMLNRF